MSGPLHGIRVVELAGIGPGPFAGMLLADMGADVLRVDRPGGGMMSVAVAGSRFDLLSRGRRSVVVDLRRPEGADVVLRLVDHADVLLEGYRPGVAERLGVGPQECLARNPRLVYGRMTGWGQDGPLARTAGHDITYLALTGALHAFGRRGEPPAVPANLVGDFGGGGAYLVMGVLAALLEAHRSGRGQVVDAAIVDGAASLMTMLYGMLAAGAWRDERGVNLLDTGAPFYDVYACADGRHVAVGALEPQFYAQLLAGLGLSAEEGDRTDPARWPALRQRFAEIFATRTRDEWAEQFAATDACVAPVLSMTEAPQHPHLAARKTYSAVDDAGGVVQPAPAPRFAATPGAIAGPPPTVGQHTVSALREWGIEDVEQLREAGVVVQA